jgi:transcriptional regulator with XRE-family HTH domain
VLTLEFARRLKKFTQTDLSIATQIPQRFISDFECGKVWPTPAQRATLAAALEVPPDSLMEPATITHEPVAVAS